MFLQLTWEVNTNIKAQILLTVTSTEEASRCQGRFALSKPNAQILPVSTIGLCCRRVIAEVKCASHLKVVFADKKFKQAFIWEFQKIQLGICKCWQTCKIAALRRLTEVQCLVGGATTHWSKQRGRNQTCLPSFVWQLPGFLILFSPVTPKTNTLGWNLVSEIYSCFSGVNLTVSYKEDLHRLTLLNTVKLREKVEMNGYSFFLMSRGMEDIKYTGQAEILKQRERWAYFTQHIIILWHLSQDTAGAKNKCWFRKRLEKLMEKKVHRALLTQSWRSNLQFRKFPQQQVAGKVKPQYDHSASARILHFSLNQESDTGCLWRWDSQWDDPLAWPTMAISGSHYNDWQY